MMNKSLLAHSAKSSRNSIYGFQQVRILKRRCAKSTLQKKSRRFRRLLKLITGRRQQSGQEPLGVQTRTTPVINEKA